MFRETTSFIFQPLFSLCDKRKPNTKTDESLHCSHFPFASLFPSEAACKVAAALLRFLSQAWIEKYRGEGLSLVPQIFIPDMVSDNEKRRSYAV